MMVSRLHRRPRASLLFALALLLLSAGASRVKAQYGGAATQSQIGEFPSDTPTGRSIDPAQEMRRMKTLNAMRQKSMVSDATRLLALARQLNSGVAPDGAALTADQRFKLATEIEKLAHSVKQKMSYSMSPGMQLRGPLPDGVQ